MFCRNSEVSEEAEQIIKGLLQLNADRRFTATQVRVRLESLLKRNTSQSSDRAVPEFHVDQTPTPPTTMPAVLKQLKIPRKSRFIKVALP